MSSTNCTVCLLNNRSDPSIKSGHYWESSKSFCELPNTLPDHVDRDLAMTSNLGAVLRQNKL